MDYLAEVMGITVNISEWAMEKKLPYYLVDSYQFKQVSLDNTTCLFLAPKGVLSTLPDLKKHLTRVKEVASVPLVLELPAINARRRQSLINSRIPFIVPNSQVYLPFMGVYLQEKYAVDAEPKETLIPAAQLVLLHYIYENDDQLYSAHLPQQLSLAPMQITRAIQQLDYLGLITTCKNGVKKIMEGTAHGRELFQKSLPHLLDPVKRRIYSDIDSSLETLPLSGQSALAEYSHLNPPRLQTRAFFNTKTIVERSAELVDYESQIELELWRYNPTILSHRQGLIDPLSLFVSLGQQEDERVMQAMEILLDNVFGSESHG